LLNKSLLVTKNSIERLLWYLANSNNSNINSEIGHLFACLQDEFGSLAHSFNKMANRLHHTTTSIELLENEISERKQVEEEREKLIKCM